MATATKQASVTEIRKALELFVEDGQHFEIRAPKATHPDYGKAKVTLSFNASSENLSDAAEQAAVFSDCAPGTYITLNPVRPGLKGSAKDTDIQRRRLVLIDSDPVRPADISSTKKEKAASLVMAMAIMAFLRERGINCLTLIDSGNGYHVLVFVDLAADDGGLVKSFLEALARRFDNDACKVDTKVANASRITKLPGTMARKGEDTPKRPHRFSKILETPDDRTPVTADQIAAIVAELAPKVDLAAEIERKRTRAEAEADARPKAKRKNSAEGKWTPEMRAIAYLEKCEPSVSGQNGHDKAFWAACQIGPGFELAPETTFRILRDHFSPRCSPEWSEAEIRHKVEDAYAKRTDRGFLLNAERQPSSNGNGRRNGPTPAGPQDPDYILGKRDIPVSCAANSKTWLATYKPPDWARYDRFRRAILLGGDPLTDQHIIELTLEIETSLRTPWAQDHIRSALLHLAHQNEYSSLIKYLDGLQWDGVGRIEDFFSDHYGVARTPYHAEVGRILFLSPVARAYQPGCKADTMPILIGLQGVGKSRGVAALCPVADWFTDDIGNDMFAGKAGEGLQGKWIIEMGELARVNRSTVEVVKSFISRPVDRYRPPYGRIAQDFPRTCVFVGTTNADQPLQDDENRRYLPVRVGEGDPDGIAAARDQLWAEAVHRYKGGEKWWTTASNLIEETKKQGRTATATDVYVDILRPRLATSKRTTMVEVVSMLNIPTERIDRSQQTRIGGALKRLGFTVERDPDGDRERYYVRESSNLEVGPSERLDEVGDRLF